jgi:polar amino acid transport system substrate-binding protein
LQGTGNEQGFQNLFNTTEEVFMTGQFVRTLILSLVVAVFLVCAISEGGQPLRVGITPDYPPLVFRQGDHVAGIEAELAMMLGEELGRPVKFVELKWDSQIPALLEGRTDIIMSSMTITRERQVRIAFSEPFLKSGLVAAVLAEDVPKYPTIESITNVIGSVGVVPKTTSESFVRKNFPFAQQHYITYQRQAVNELQQRRIEMFIGDAPTVIWLVSENEASIGGIWKPLNEEYLAWGMRKDDVDLLARVNAALAQFRLDGRLDKVLHKWLPKQYMEKMK